MQSEADVWLAGELDIPAAITAGRRGLVFGASSPPRLRSKRQAASWSGSAVCLGSPRTFSGLSSRTNR